MLMGVACADSSRTVPNDGMARDLGPARDATEPGDSGGGADVDPGSDAMVQAPADSGFPSNPLMGVGTVAPVDQNRRFVEGPVWRPSEGDVLFTDIPANIIYRWTENEGATTFRQPSNNANGLFLDREGRLLAAEHGTRRVSRTLPDGTIETVADRFEGSRLNSPNDITVRSDGTIYFTDPPYGIQDSQRELDFIGVFRVQPDGALSAEWRAPTLESRPNGIGLSPDERTLYVADTTAELIRAYDVAADGSLGAPRTFAPTSPLPDGMAIDIGGNVYQSVETGIEVYAPDGRRWGLIEVPEVATNVTFGDADRRTLYITAQTSLYRVRVPIPGRSYQSDN